MNPILQLIMKYPKVAFLGAMLAIAAFVSCLSPQQQEGFNKFTKIAAPLVVGIAQYAELKGDLPPGTTVTISKGTAIITSDGTNEQKILALKDLGLAEAVNAGALKEGDRMIVDQTGTALVQLVKDLQPKDVVPLPAIVQPPQLEHAPGPAIPIIVRPEGPSNPLLPPAGG